MKKTIFLAVMILTILTGCASKNMSKTTCKIASSTVYVTTMIASKGKASVSKNCD